MIGSFMLEETASLQVFFQQYVVKKSVLQRPMQMFHFIFFSIWTLKTKIPRSVQLVVNEAHNGALIACNRLTFKLIQV